jgi:hypothetical protein
MEALHEYAQKDMENKARLGSPAVRAQVMAAPIITRDAPKPKTVTSKLTGETVKVSLSEERYPHEEDRPTPVPEAEPVASGEERPGELADIMADMTKADSTDGESEDKPKKRKGK